MRNDQLFEIALQRIMWLCGWIAYFAFTAVLIGFIVWTYTDDRVPIIVALMMRGMVLLGWGLVSFLGLFYICDEEPQ